MIETLKKEREEAMKQYTEGQKILVQLEGFIRGLDMMIAKHTPVPDVADPTGTQKT